ncbi:MULTISPECIES: MerR family transcriptional regulator [unclassified Pseudofrankia]|uniref:MerR family transcriptional regulator n=1 Tax=unclassified Pseudofrankia TaxID=2994372 RepID=UPI0008DA1214|nr:MULTISPECIES: MerR family transcriptional regulator [unclassified Pseudofrankia]MDT3442894.1 MerR family transcriptional regulator [Pseudofrankia sp. BMG5.37]OHV59257.1 MerR family transcriptional regulator [Pseudofrankia sp. BMG5.36]
MEMMSIGETAARFGLNASALRYWDERGLVRPAARRDGRRMYGPAELRRIALIQILQQVGVGLTTAAAVLDEPGGEWRQVVRDQIAELDRLIERATLAKELLAHALACPTERPTRECATMLGLLDKRVAGASFEQLVADHGHQPACAP